MKKKMTILAALVLAVIVTGSSVAGTYAKYTSTFNGTTSAARVAKWAVSVGDKNQSTATQEFTFNLFESVNDSNVKTGVSENIIAPGTTGSFAIALANTSEVNAEYTVDYTITNTDNVPLEFSIDNGQTWTTGLADVTNPVAIAMNNGNDTITIKWRWAFTGSESENYTSTQTDDTDTTLGIAGTAAPTVKAKVVVTQVD